MPKLLCIGEVMAEIRFDREGRQTLNYAGDTYNTAVYCARALGDAASVSFLSRIGFDTLSDGFILSAEHQGMDLSQIERDPERNIGIYAISTDDQGERHFDYWRANSAARQLFADGSTHTELPDAEVIYFSGITLAIMAPDARDRLLTAARQKALSGQTSIAFDSNYRPRLWESKASAQDAIGRAWEIADIALPSIDDEMNLFDDVNEQAVVDRFRARDWRSGAIKRGALGPVAPHLPAEQHPEFARKSRVVDTTAAGDSFNGGFLAALIKGADLSDCLEAGHNIASKVVGQSGAIIPSGSLEAR
jgi:2-dehydro-3-deoxygluconokinase